MIYPYPHYPCDPCEGECTKKQWKCWDDYGYLDPDAPVWNSKMCCLDLSGGAPQVSTQRNAGVVYLFFVIFFNVLSPGFWQVFPSFRDKHIDTMCLKHTFFVMRFIKARVMKTKVTENEWPCLCSGGISEAVHAMRLTAFLIPSSMQRTNGAPLTCRQDKMTRYSLVAKK